MDRQTKRTHVKSHLYGATAGVAFGFLTAFLFYDFWSTHPGFGVGLLIAFLILPFSVSRLLRYKQSPEQQASSLDKGKDCFPAGADRPSTSPVDSPINTTEQPPETMSKEEQRTGAWHALKGRTLNDARVLLVTADKSDRHQLKYHLSGWQARVTLSDNSVRAFTELMSAADEGNPYHIVLVDQRHLDMEPRQFAVSIRSEASLQDLSLIHVGPENSHLWEQQLLSTGYSCVLHTPVDKTLLFNALCTANRNLVKQPEKVASFIKHYAKERFTLPPLEILVAAHAANLKQIYRILKRAGHQVFTVDHGEQALNALEVHHFDLVILEADMPVMSGIEAITLYRFTHIHKPWLPFILLTAETTADAATKYNHADIDACLNGTIRTQSLLATIKQVITDKNKKRATTATEEQGKTTAPAPPKDEVLGQSALRNLEELGSGQAFVHKLIESFLQDSENHLSHMEKAFAAQKHQAYIDHAHALKDIAGNLGALSVYKLSVKACRLEAKEFQEKGGLQISGIRIAFKDTRRALMNYMSKQDNSASRH